jgi:hypothetical protein
VTVVKTDIGFLVTEVQRLSCASRSAADGSNVRFSVGFVDDLDQVHVLGRDHFLIDQRAPQPVDQAAPEGFVHQDDGNAARLARLHQRQRLHQLVHRAEAAGQYDIGGSELHEHDLAREEMAEGLADVLVGIAGLFVRQLDVQPDRQRLAEIGALVGRLHDARSATGDHGEPCVGQLARGFLGERVVRMPRRHSRAAEHRHRRADMGKAFCRLDELCHNPEDPPRLARGPGLLDQFGRQRDRNLLLFTHCLPLAASADENSAAH